MRMVKGRLQIQKSLAGLPVRLMQDRFAALQLFIVRMQGVVIALGSHDFLTSNEESELDPVVNAGPHQG